jgi:hypothetical protein
MVADGFVERSRFARLRTRAGIIREIGSGDLKLGFLKYDGLTVRIHGDVAVLQGIADSTRYLAGCRSAASSGASACSHGVPAAGRRWPCDTR